MEGTARVNTTATTFIIKELDAIPRSGWLRKGVPREECETVGDHVRKVVQAAAIIGPAFDADTERLVAMATIHDAPEIIIGDITPHDGISQEEQHTREAKALESLRNQLGLEAETITELWYESEAKTSPEAILLHQLDKMDAAVQAIVYAHEGYPVEEFYPYALARVTDIRLRSVLERLQRLQPQDPYETYFALLEELQ